MALALTPFDPISLATDAARIGAEILLGYWQQLGKDDAALKARNDWVSRADRESEAAIIDFLRKSSPGDGFLGEESGASADGTTGRTWIIDPLDGTSNYLQHFPVWAISIGLEQDGEMVAGLVYQPLHDDLFTAEQGSGAFRNGKKIAVSNQQGIEGAFLATGFPFRAQQHLDPYVRIFRDVVSTSKGVRRAGSAAVDLAYTAAGIFDGFFELHLGPWDIAAGAVLIKEAGGVVTDFSGGNDFWKRGNVVGAPPGVHAELLETIGRHVKEEDLVR